MSSNGPMVTGESQYIMDIPALEPERKKLRVAGVEVEMRDNEEISLRQTARLIRLLRDVDLTNIVNIYRLSEEQFEKIYTAMELIFDLAFVTDGEPGIPRDVLDRINEVGQLNIALAFVEDFFGATRTRKILDSQEQEDQVVQEGLAEELARIDGSTGADKSPDSGSGSEGQ